MLEKRVSMGEDSEIRCRRYCIRDRYTRSLCCGEFASVSQPLQLLQPGVTPRVDKFGLEGLAPFGQVPDFERLAGWRKVR